MICSTLMSVGASTTHLGRCSRKVCSGAEAFRSTPLTHVPPCAVNLCLGLHLMNGNGPSQLARTMWSEFWDIEVLIGPEDERKL